MKLILWFNNIKETIARYQEFIQVLFLNTLMWLYTVILGYLFIGQRKLNLY